jgi:hypothetical protein
MKTRPCAIQLLGGLAALLALVLCGCDGNRGAVAGTVRFAGQPLKTGYVTFTSEANPGVEVSSLIHEGGSYRIADCPPGPVKIAVKAAVPRSGQGRASNKPAPAPQPPIPPRYASPNTSKLTYTVHPGAQEHDIDLMP